MGYQIVQTSNVSISGVPPVFTAVGSVSHDGTYNEVKRIMLLLQDQFPDMNFHILVVKCPCGRGCRP